MKQDTKFLPLCLLLKGDRERNFEKSQLLYRGADKTLARPGRKQAGPVKSVMGSEMDCVGQGMDRWWTLVNVVMNLQVPQNAGNVACFLPGRAKDLSAPLYIY